ncbi:MAG TPA: glycoside hydrolase [Nitrospirae bacterium]|nr:glycoside hydrolase [Nitrospirota bacterium]HDZ02907.1 glycoside hydrolase [Nitrospirota bacterium]
MQKNVKKSNKCGGKGIEKRYMKSKATCRVTFRLPKEAAPGAKTVTIVGDFNNWNITETPMKRLKNGDFKLTLELPCDREYSFRYLIDANRWEKDWFADKHIPGEEEEVDNSVVVV